MKSMLEERPFGNTCEHVTIIGLGGSYLDKCSLDDGVATVKRALELGINYFDTSPGYGHGASQVILGKTLGNCKEPYLLATKLGQFIKPEHFRSTDFVRTQLWENLRALRRSKVDVLQIHNADLACWWKDNALRNELLNVNESYDFVDSPVMQVLNNVKAQKTCRFIGVTSGYPDEIAHIIRHVHVDTCLVAYQYNIVFRRGRQKVLSLTREKGIAYVAGGILNNFTGVHPEWLINPPLWVTSEVKKSLFKLYELQRTSRFSMVNLAVRYLVADQDISTILIGAATPKELEESVNAAQQGPLPYDLHQAIEELGILSSRF